jgi:hypothetical protein
VASRIQEYPPASVAGLMVRFGRAEFQGAMIVLAVGLPIAGAEKTTLSGGRAGQRLG